MVQKVWHKLWAEAREMAESGVDELVWGRQRMVRQNIKMVQKEWQKFWAEAREMGCGEGDELWTEVREMDRIEGRLNSMGEKKGYVKTEKWIKRSGTRYGQRPG